MSLSTEEIKEIIALLEASGWEEAQVVAGEVTITVSKREGGLLAAPPSAAPAVPAPAASTPAPAPSAPAPAPSASAEPAPEGDVVAAPSVGIFWRAPEPGAQPFVEVGDEVDAGQTLCIVEVMKLMNHVAAERAGTVAAIHAANGEHVEFGTALFTLA
jgi:acetyl-CoA carboxylase biotin carboxyl carrier protein